MVMTPSEQCKQAGLRSLTELAILSSEPDASVTDLKSRARTLINWHKDKPILFATVLAGAVSLKSTKSGDTVCSACGDKWTSHHLRCEGSEEPYGPDNELPGMWENADFTGGNYEA